MSGRHLCGRLLLEIAVADYNPAETPLPKVCSATISSVLGEIHLQETIKPILLLNDVKRFLSLGRVAEVSDNDVVIFKQIREAVTVNSGSLEDEYLTKYTIYTTERVLSETRNRNINFYYINL